LSHESRHFIGFAFAERRSIYTALRLRIEFRHRIPASLMRYRAIFTGVYSGLPSPSDDDCRVMITAYRKPAFAAFVNTNGERHLLSVAAITANLARVSWINSFKRPAGIFSFAFRHREKASPSHIADRLGEMAILDHPSVERSTCALVRSVVRHPGRRTRSSSRRDRFTTWRI
jgi:hypothetical protein